ncbi:SCO family protein [Ideonella sp. A 288]|uniref:SCO family protein n=1 Tax=Ideonella sp. A 288 TaxID=1962181 RepID=UPI000B4B7ABA|nr:SCO family protein [Ideonella sp. A 288]
MPILAVPRHGVVALGLVVVALASGWPATAGAQVDHRHHHATAKALPEGLSRRVVDVRLPDVTVQQHDGRKLRFAQQFAGEAPVVVNFIYTSCTAICPPMTQILAHTQHTLGDRVGQLRMVSVSIDPEHDTAARLAEYAGRFSAGPQWHFDTGSQATSDAIQRAFGVYSPDRMSHTPTTFVRARGATRWVRLDGFATPELLIREAMGDH